MAYYLICSNSEIVSVIYDALLNLTIAHVEELLVWITYMYVPLTLTWEIYILRYVTRKLSKFYRYQTESVGR